MVLGDLGASWAPLGVVLGGHGAVDGPNRAEATLLGQKIKKGTKKGRPFEVTSVVGMENPTELR